jgi:ribonuclease P protein component
VVRLSRAVNSKDGPATTSKLKAELREELSRLFAAQIAAQARSVAAPPPSAP